ncbi:MAG: hypothetical protein AB7K09_24020 [Planctomycetota bacterium]
MTHHSRHSRHTVVALLLIALAVLAGHAHADDPVVRYEITDLHFAHHLFGFELDVPRGWAVEGGDDARSSSGVQSAEAYFERDGRTATGHMEVQWNATITPQKYMEQLDEVFGEGTDKVASGEALRLRMGPGVANRYRATTTNGDKVAVWVVATGSKEWKLGFLFACPEDDFAKFRNEFLSILNSVKFGKPASGKPVRHVLAALKLSLETPDPLWEMDDGSYWPGQPSSAQFNFTRQPFAAYSLLGSVEGNKDDLPAFAKEIAASISQLNQKNDTVQAQGRGAQLKVAGEKAWQVQFENRASFPFTTYLVTVFNHGDRAVWLCQWTLPDNFRALKADFDSMVKSFEVVKDE